VSQIGSTARWGAAPRPNPGDRSESGDAAAQQDRAPALAALGVSKRFGVVRALDDVTLKVRAGEILALVGENGAGKSTLVRLFEGVYRPDQGTLAADGVQQTLRWPADAHALGIRVIHQEPDIIPDLSIAENLFLGDFRRIHGLFLDRADLKRRARDLLAEFGLENDLSSWRSCALFAAA
jgi:L-arabinose transport system ATP-binding protein